MAGSAVTQPLTERGKRYLKLIAQAAGDGNLGVISVIDRVTGRHAELIIIQDLVRADVVGVVPIALLFSDPIMNPFDLYDPGPMPLPPEYMQHDGTWGLDRPDPEEDRTLNEFNQP